MFYGILNLSFWGYVIFTLVVTHITIASVTIFLHRHQAHRALNLHPVVSHFFRAWLWLTTGMETRAWAAIHRKHHAKCETAEDPHSPQIVGLSQVLWEGAELYRREARNTETLTRYGQGTPDDWIELNLYRPYSAKGILVTLVIDLILLGVPGLIVWAIQMAWIPFFAAGVINGVGHFWGYRNFECPDAATNILPWGVLIGGEELHNNHHTYPTSAKLSVKWWEFDIGWVYISILSRLGLAEVKRTVPKVKVIPGKDLDAEGLRAIIANRVQIMSHYLQTVLGPVFKQSRLRREVKPLVAATEPSEAEQAALAQALEKHQSLKKVYDFKQRLHEIWGRTTASQKELLDMLQEWCCQAEATPIQKLQEFANYLRGYTLASSN